MYYIINKLKGVVMNIIQIFKQFPTHGACISYLESVRWDNEPICPYCESNNSTPLKRKLKHHCNSCNTDYSVTVNTIFHHTHLSLQKWFLAITLILNAKKGLSARQLARDLEINKNTAWRISMKIRDAMNERDQRELLSGIVEVDETYVGGKPRKGSKHNKRGRGTKKTPVVGFIERDGKVKASAEIKRNLTAKRLSTLVRRNVDIRNTTLITDKYKGYRGIHNFMLHKTIDHQKWYVDGDAHTNNIESFWAILKRGIAGQFHKVSDKYLQKYLDEFCYRFNYRNYEDVFGLTIQRALGI